MPRSCIPPSLKMSFLSWAARDSPTCGLMLASWLSARGYCFSSRQLGRTLCGLQGHTIGLLFGHGDCATSLRDGRAGCEVVSSTTTEDLVMCIIWCCVLAVFYLSHHPSQTWGLIDLAAAKREASEEDFGPNNMTGAVGIRRRHHFLPHLALAYTVWFQPWPVHFVASFRPRSGASCR